MEAMLPLIWLSIIAFGILMYIVLDGFSLGIGILYPLAKSADERTMMMNAILPVWDGNETWLVFGGAALYGAFPHAFSILLPYLYVPLLIMLLALLFRGVAFEFRIRSARSRTFWSICFFIGSLAAAFSQGLILAAFIQGIPILIGDQYVASEYGWFSKFSLFAGFAMVLAYPLLGATWLIAKTDGSVQRHMYYYAKVSLGIIVALFIVALVWTPIVNPSIAQKWLAEKYLFGSVMLLMIVLLGLILIALHKKRQYYPFYLSAILFGLAYLSLMGSIFPYIVPPNIAYWQVAAPSSTLMFILPGAVILLPILLGYTVYSYYIFRGKVSHESYYH